MKTFKIEKLDKGVTGLHLTKLTRK